MKLQDALLRMTSFSGSLRRTPVGEKTYYVYIMASRSRTLSVGFTSEIEVRVRQHKEGGFERFSHTYQCTRLVYLERFGDVHEGIAREKQLKGWARSKKIWLIERENPTWADLSEDWGKPIQMYEATQS
jgi:putative endonuclease